MNSKELNQLRASAKKLESSLKRFKKAKYPKNESAMALSRIGEFILKECKGVVKKYPRKGKV